MRRFLVLVALALCAGNAWADESDSDSFGVDPIPQIHVRSPWYLPRQLTLAGVLGRTTTPQLRLGWEWTFIQEREDALMGVLEGGGGTSLSTPDQPDLNEGVPAISWFSYTTVQAGLGYRDVFAQDWAWGFKLIAGPAWARARSPGLADDHQLIGLVEGRLELGHYFGPVQVGLTGGVQEVMGHPAREYASYGAGGLVLGIFTNWR